MAFEKMKEKMQELNNPIDDSLKDDLTEKLSLIFSKSVFMARVFLDCYDAFKLNMDDSKETIDYLNKFEALEKKLRKEFQNYGNGLEYGDYSIEYRIKGIVNSNREEILNFIKTFKEVFIE